MRRYKILVTAPDDVVDKISGLLERPESVVVLSDFEGHFSSEVNIDSIVSIIYTETNELAVELSELLKSHPYLPQKLVIGGGALLDGLFNSQSLDHDLLYLPQTSVDNFLARSSYFIVEAEQARVGNKYNGIAAIEALNLHCIVSKTDSSGIIVDVNDKFCEISGYTRQELLGKSHKLINSGFHNQLFFEGLWSTIRSEKVWKGEICNRKKNGELYWVESIIMPYRLESGSQYYLSLRTDITRVKQAQIEEESRNTVLEKQQEYIKSLSTVISKAIDSAGLGSILEQLGEFISADMNARSVWYFSFEEGFVHSIYVKDAERRFNEDVFSLFEQQHRFSDSFSADKDYFGDLEGLKGINKDIVIFLKDLGIGSAFCFNVNCEGGRLTADFFVIEKEHVSNQDHIFFQSVRNQLNTYYLLRKISTSNKKLIEKERSLDLSAKYAQVGSWDLDLVSGVLRWSDEVASLLGISERILYTNLRGFYKVVHPEDRVAIREAVAESIRCNKTLQMTYRVIWPDGSLRWLQQSGDVLRDETGQALRMLGVASDITKQKLFESELQLARDSAESASRSKNLFISSMSHELRTPMNSIMGFTQLLQSRHKDEKSVIWLDHISTASQHLMKLLNDMLDLAKIESESFDVELSKVAIDRLIGRLASIVEGIRGTSEIIVSIDDEIRELAIECDETRLQQVILNLVSNALKYGGGNKIILSVRRENDFIAFSVTDFGLGIAKEKQGHLFLPFERLGKEASNIEGTGLGLSVAKRLIELMNGSIGFESVEGRGSTFWVKLPIPKGSPLALNETSLSGNALTSGNKNILYLEDNQASIRLMEHVFKPFNNVSLYTAKSILEAKEVLNTIEFDLLIIDVNLPDGNGIDFYDTLQNKSIPAIVLSANTNRDSILYAESKGFKDYITKPFVIQDVLDRSQDALLAN